VFALAEPQAHGFGVHLQHGSQLLNAVEQHLGLGGLGQGHQALDERDQVAKALADKPGGSKIGSGHSEADNTLKRKNWTFFRIASKTLSFELTE
jgi:hypothetical protein